MDALIQINSAQPLHRRIIFHAHALFSTRTRLDVHQYGSAVKRLAVRARAGVEAI